MYPNLYFLFEDLFGFSHPFLKLVNSFGFFVALAFIAASALLSRELKRKEEEGFMESEYRILVKGQKLKWSEVGYSTLVGFILGYKFVYLLLNSGTLFTPDSLPQEHIFSLDGSILWGVLLAIAMGGYTYWRGKKEELPEPIKEKVTFHKYEYTGGITMVAAISGVLGAKLFHLFENPREFMAFFEDPSIQGFIGGLTIYGGLIVGGVVTYLYAKKKGIPGIHLLDAAAPGLMISYGIGRIGCQVSGDGDWGIANPNPKPDWLSWLPDWMWAYEYPNNVNAVRGFDPLGGYSGKPIEPGMEWPIFEGYGTYLDPAVYPTPFYETVIATIFFLILWKLRKKITIPGVLFGMYLIMNGFSRFWIEKIRVNNIMDNLNITQAELISTIMFLSGIAMILILVKRHKKA